MRTGTLPCTWPAARYALFIQSKRPWATTVPLTNTIFLHHFLWMLSSSAQQQLVHFFSLSFCFFLTGSWDVCPADSGGDPQSNTHKCHQQCSANVRHIHNITYFKVFQASSLHMCLSRSHLVGILKIPLCCLWLFTHWNWGSEDSEW